MKGGHFRDFLRDGTVKVIGPKIEHQKRIEPVDFGGEGAPNSQGDEGEGGERGEAREGGEEGVGGEHRRHGGPAIAGDGEGRDAVAGAGDGERGGRGEVAEAIVGLAGEGGERGGVLEDALEAD